jgi:hypothetical protein
MFGTDDFTPPDPNQGWLQPEFRDRFPKDKENKNEN